MDYPIYEMENKSHVWNHQPESHFPKMISLWAFPKLKWRIPSHHHGNQDAERLARSTAHTDPQFGSEHWNVKQKTSEKIDETVKHDETPMNDG
jgi:hypothetical protein